MKVLVIDNGTTLLNKLKKLIPDSIQSIKSYNNIHTNEEEDFDLVVLSGGSICSVEGNEDRFHKEIKLIKNANKPLIGICFGCELIVEAFGGSLKKMPIKENGIKEIRITVNDLYKKSKINVYESHEWAIDRLPQNFNILAESRNGPEIIKHTDLPIYGFQFHPENLVEESDGDEIFLGLLKIINNR